DGRQTTYFEWLGAGVYTPDYRSASLHESEHCIKQLYYGYSDTAIYLRLDLKSQLASDLADFEVRVGIRTDRSQRIHAQITGGRLNGIELWQDDQQKVLPSQPGAAIRAAYRDIFEITLPYAALEIKPQQKISMQVSFWLDHLPVQVLPKEGWLPLEMSDDVVGW
ncbi:MAG TPA: hypothetical protein VKV79_03780, partial [Terriglobia bacterium]|nr:hypothetical protein [Terriglobia bacterium]